MSVTRTADRREPSPPDSRPSRTSRTSRRSGAPRAPGTARTARARAAADAALAHPQGAVQPPDSAVTDEAATHDRPAETDGAASRTRARASTTRAADRSARSGAPRTRRSRSEVTGLTRAPRHRIVLACTAALAAGLFAVLMLNTIISQGAFQQNELEIELIGLAEHEERLVRELQVAESPLRVERAARRLGMVPAASPVFLSLADGRVLGEPVPAEAEPGRVSFKDAPGLLRVPTSAPSPASAATRRPAPASSADPAMGVDPATSVQAPAAPVPGPAPSAAVPAAQSDGATAPTGQGAQ